jgi:hypothetical protein
VVLNIFRSCWFLNQDHLAANILSSQKDNCSCFCWVDFQPEFHAHLVQCMLVLLPPLCPVAKGKKVMFVFLLEILASTGVPVVLIGCPCAAAYVIAWSVPVGPSRVSGEILDVVAM